MSIRAAFFAHNIVHHGSTGFLALFWVVTHGGFVEINLDNPFSKDVFAENADLKESDRLGGQRGNERQGLFGVANTIASQRPSTISIFSMTLICWQRLSSGEVDMKREVSHTYADCN